MCEIECLFHFSMLSLPSSKGDHALQGNSEITIINRMWLVSRTRLRVFDGKLVEQHLARNTFDPPSLPA